MHVLIMRGQKTLKTGKVWDETSRGVRMRPVGSDRKSVNTCECSTFAQSRTLTHGVRIMHIHDRSMYIKQPYLLLFSSQKLSNGNQGYQM